MRPRLRRTLVATLIVGVLGALAYPKVRPLLAPSGPSTAPAARPAAASSGGVIRVSAVTLQPSPLAETITATGTLRAEEAVELQAEVSGKIVHIDFLEGSRVARGALLVKINDAELRASLARATSRKALAVLKERRLAALLETGGAKREDYDTALNEVSVQLAEIELIEAQIAKTEIRAPFDGVIGLRFVSEGAFITATAASTVRIATLQALDRLKVDFSIPERYAARLIPSSPIRFSLTGASRLYSGRLLAAEPRIDIGTRTLLLRALAENPDGRLLPGSFATVELTLDTIPDALLVPAVAVIPGLTDKTVFVAQDGKAVRRSVQTGTRTETHVHILSGLAPGDVVITSGLQLLRAGLPVQIAPADPAVASR